MTNKEAIAILLKSQIFLARNCGKTDMYNAVNLAIKALENERPQTISCFNCKHDYKIATDEPCKYCNDKFSEWEAKGDKEEEG